MLYRELPMSERLDRIGEILAKGVYLYLKKGKLTPKSVSQEKRTTFSKHRIKNSEKGVST